MVFKLAEMVNEKIEEGSLLTIGIEISGGRIMDAVIPDTINTDSGIYIEGEYLSLNLPDVNEQDISYNEDDEEFIIKHGNAIYYLG